MKQEENKNRMGTKNMFLESCHELNLSLAQDLTEERIYEAFDKLKKVSERCIQNNIAPSFELKNKGIARDYLLEKVRQIVK